MVRCLPKPVDNNLDWHLLINLIIIRNKILNTYLFDAITIYQGVWKARMNGITLKTAYSICIEFHLAGRQYDLVFSVFIVTD